MAINLKSFICSTALLAAMAGCSARNRYPDVDIGWHNSSYTTVFGRLQRVPAANADDPPYWVVRFDDSQAPYRGELALMPQEAMVGYAGGEPVEIRGEISPQQTNDPFNGRWYKVESIRLWEGLR